MTVDTATFQAGDPVELARDIPGRKQLRAGLRGMIVAAGDGVPWGMVSVEIASGSARRVWLLHARHVALVARPAPAPAGPEDATKVPKSAHAGARNLVAGAGRQGAGGNGDVEMATLPRARSVGGGAFRHTPINADETLPRARRGERVTRSFAQPWRRQIALRARGAPLRKLRAHKSAPDSLARAGSALKQPHGREVTSWTPGNPMGVE